MVWTPKAQFIGRLFTGRSSVYEVKKEAKKLGIGVAITAAVVGAALYPATVLRAAKTVIPKTLKGKVLTGISGLIGYGVLKESPIARKFAKKTAVKITKVPKEAVSLGTGIGKVIEKEKVFGKEDIKKAVKTVGIVGGVAALGAVVIPKVIEKVKDRGEKPIITPEAKAVIPEPEKQLIKEKPVGIEGETPITPEVTTITTGKKPYKRRRATKQPSVRQYVKVNVINRATATGLRQTHKYLNQELLN